MEELAERVAALETAGPVVIDATPAVDDLDAPPPPVVDKPAEKPAGDKPKKNGWFS